MSNNTSIILITAIEDGAKQDDEHPNVEKLDMYFKDEWGTLKTLYKVDEYAGGSKVMGCDVFMACVKHIIKADFIKWFYSIDWEDPECVQLLIKEEDDDQFTVYKPKI